jgi:hypothetical protein
MPCNEERVEGALGTARFAVSQVRNEKGDMHRKLPLSERQVLPKYIRKSKESRIKLPWRAILVYGTYFINYINKL